MTQKTTKTGLYVISPQSFKLKEFKAQLENAFSGGRIDVFQLRMKDAPESEIIEACRELMPLCHKYNTPFILNDYINLVNKTGADGLHIGIDDTNIEKARKELKNKTIGVSCYGSVDRAMDQAEKGADYVAFGAFYETQTKTPRARPQPEILKWWVTNSTIPCVAIGGIKPDNCQPLIANGADFIAIVTGIWNDNESPAKAVEKFRMELGG